MQRNDFAIPRKSRNQSTSQHYISDVALNSEQFRNIYQPVILSHLSSSCQDRESIRIIRCRIIDNKQLETRFSNFRRSLESQGLPSDVSFGYTLLSDNLREMELIAQWGLSVNNNFVGDLGEPANGVYLSGHPDLVTPAPFLGRTILRILACKILKGKCSVVGLGSYHLLPKRGYHSHSAMQPVDCKLLRHDNYRCDQIFLFEEKGAGYSKSPANVLPFAIYDVQFPPNSVLSFKGTDSIVWSGNLLIGNKRYSRVSLCSLAAATKPPLLDVLEVTDLIHWTACLAFSPILELLKPPALGEVALKKEVLLVHSQRLVYYFTLFSEDDSQDFVLLHESMRIKQAAGVTIFPSVGIFILLPNGLFSDLLTLPKTAGNIFHCLYLTCDLNCSLINGAFETMSTEENDEFVRPLLLQERIDGLDVRIQELVRNVAKKILFTEETSNKSRIEVSNATAGAIDMDIADSDDDEEKKGWRVERMDTTSGLQKSLRERSLSNSNLKLKPDSPHSVDETISKDKRLLCSNPQHEKMLVNRDPRKRVVSKQDLPIPLCSVVGRNTSEWGSFPKHPDAKKKRLPSSSDLYAIDFRGYSPSDAISSGESSPTTPSQSKRSPSSSSPNLKDNDSTAVAVLRNQSELDSTESPASPPHEPGVFVATAPKIISDYDMRSATDASFQTPVRQYRPPEVTPFTALASVEAMKNSRSLVEDIPKKHEIKIDSEEVHSTSTQNNENLVTNDEPTYILPELISFPHHSIQKNRAENEKHLQWDILPNSKDDRDLTFWKINTGPVGSSDVDMRTTHTISSTSDISRELTASTTHHVTPAMQAPIVFSNGDTDHRVISSAVRPSTSAQPPEVFTNESTSHFRAHSYVPPSFTGPFQYRSASLTNYMPGFKQPRVYGFFNQPTIHSQSKPYYARTNLGGNSSVRQGVLMIDDAQITTGAFASSSSNSGLVERRAYYEEIVKEYESLKVIQTMKPHECDKNKHDAKVLLKCLNHTANANQKCTLIYLTDVAKDSSMGKQIALTGFKICHSTELLKKFDI